MNIEQNQTPRAAASPGLTAAVSMHVGRPEEQNVVEALSRNSAKGHLPMLRVRIAHVFTTFVLLASMAVLGGCSKKEEVAAPPQSRPLTPSAPPAPQPAPTPSSNALLSTQGDMPGLTLTVLELKRSANALTLKFALQSKDGMAFHADFGEGGKEYDSVGGVHLIDAANKKKYFVVRDADGACVCSRNMPNIAPGSQSLLWAKFPAPPDDVQKITVEIPHFPPTEDVPITR